MGLDNGIVLKIKDAEKFGRVPMWVQSGDIFSFDGESVDIMYWRKCWNVRMEIFSALEVACERDDGSYVMDLESFIFVLKVLKSIYNEKNWDSSMSIWEWEEVKDNYRARLRFGLRVAKWLKRKPADSYEIEFYDSY